MHKTRFNVDRFDLGVSSAFTPCAGSLPPNGHSHLIEQLYLLVSMTVSS